jgi:hypothetical protein
MGKITEALDKFQDLVEQVTKKNFIIIQKDNDVNKILKGKEKDKYLNISFIKKGTEPYERRFIIKDLRKSPFPKEKINFSSNRTFKFPKGKFVDSSGDRRTYENLDSAFEAEFKWLLGVR